MRNCLYLKGPRIMYLLMCQRCLMKRCLISWISPKDCIIINFITFALDGHSTPFITTIPGRSLRPGTNGAAKDQPRDLPEGVAAAYVVGPLPGQAAEYVE